MVTQVGELVCEGLTKRYGDTMALDSVSLSVPSSGIFALIGRNGAGKTTLIRILATEVEPTSGRAWINGIDVVKEDKKLREKIAIVPQEARTIAWMTPKQTVLSYLLWRGFGYGEAKNRAADSLARLGIAKYGDKLNRTLSGGTKRKVLAATVLASESEVIFLDEPTTGLDPISRREFWEILRELGKDRFIFLTTHYLEEAEQLADRIGILKEGKLAASGSLDSLRGTIRYQYSVKLPPNVQPPKVVEGEIMTGKNGETQVLTGEEEAFSIARKLSESGVRFSVSPVTLDDIFLQLDSESATDGDSN
ncbi:MAG: ABC transporter ATP-binding protein [Thaumarchaeota archaeon]|nr:ABC transporter ATP-binding protein [Nitrososphaerota archaeon]